MPVDVVAILAAFDAKASSARVIAEQTGVSRHSVMRVLDEHRPGWARLTRIRRMSGNTALVLYEYGKLGVPDISAIAKAVGCTPQGVRAALSRWTAYKPEALSKAELVIAAFDSGMTGISRMARRAGCSHTHVVKTLDRYRPKWRGAPRPVRPKLFEHVAIRHRRATSARTILQRLQAPLWSYEFNLTDWDFVRVTPGDTERIDLLERLARGEAVSDRAIVKVFPRRRAPTKGRRKGRRYVFR